MSGCSVATRRHIDLSGIGLGKGDELRERLGRKGWIHFHDEGSTNNACHRNNVADEIVAEIVVERGIDRVRRIDLEECITVGRRAYHDFSANGSAGARSVLYYERMTEALR